MHRKLCAVGLVLSFLCVGVPTTIADDEVVSALGVDRISFRMSTFPLQMEFARKRKPAIPLESLAHYDLVTLEISTTFRTGFTLEATGRLLMDATANLGGSMSLRGGYAFALSADEEAARSAYLVPLLGYR